ncbi:hypothetical protein [Luteimonas terricola]|uniref:Uncharacterized protein n=1 Tax=Luteimonas terricola TaxID=645597 RepID=A0ABQ2E9B0_9GAMM|nr:hypothetical protein [Luteimonas terricola]GGK01178.1 hypothetical protein GCM10011394_08000 [Luteimonas terricola]
MNHKTLLTTAVLATLFALSTAHAQDAAADATADAEVVARATVPAERLADRYAELAGSTEAAVDLVDSLREGSETSAAMAYGEINLTLAMAEAMLEGGAVADLDTALASVLDLRVDGMGWGQIARELDFNLGELVSAPRRALGARGHAEVDLAVSGEAAGHGTANAGGAGAGAATAADARSRAGVGADVSAGARANARIEAGARGDISGRPEGAVKPVLPTRALLPERPLLPERAQRPERPQRVGR